MDGHVVPQQWPAQTTAPNVDAADRRRLDPVIYGATPLGGALCCDATSVSPRTRNGQLQPCAAAIDGTALRIPSARIFFPTLTVGLFDFKVYVVPALRPEQTLACHWGHRVQNFFPTLTVGLLYFKVYVVLALRPEPDCSAQPQSIPAVPKRRVSLQCPTAKYLCSAQPQDIPAMHNCRVSLQCPTAEYPCSAQPPSIPALPNRQVSLQCPTAEHPCSAQPQSILAAPNHKVPAVPNRRASLQCPTAEYPCSAKPHSII